MTADLYFLGVNPLRTVNFLQHIDTLHLQALFRICKRKPDKKCWMFLVTKNVSMANIRTIEKFALFVKTYEGGKDHPSPFSMVFNFKRFIKAEFIVVYSTGASRGVPH
jgi:hypothetical protein